MDIEDFDIVNDGGTIDPGSESAFEFVDDTGEHHIETGHVTQLTDMYENWFLDYASYVILERAVPHIQDGLKPVQRRILYAMRQIEDGRFNKVANIIGQTMQYHPHGDASIGDALVQLGQKGLLIETQGNWGNILTGDGAAASRYIEARLSKFALEVAFNHKTTGWKLSYDGRNKEPLTLPVKFPLLLAQGVEGIAVGLASKILPHNFIELIDASIAYLQGKTFELFPDFPSGGSMDVFRYNDGLRGGMVKIRAKISKIDKKTLVINELPYGQTTTTLIDSILKANDKGKIKIRKIDDNTSEQVEIVVHLVPGIDPDVTIDALYAFTDCEVAMSSNACVIREDKPCFLGVSEILRNSADNTVRLLTRELQIRLDELEEDWHTGSLEKIFIVNELYEPIKVCKTEEAILKAIEQGLQPFKKQLRREITQDDLIRLSNIPVRRISKFSSFKMDEHIRQIEFEIEETKNHLENIVPYTVNYYRQIKKKFGAGHERKTEIRSFDTIEATEVAAANMRLYINRAEGFIGTGLKKDEYICDCSDIDDIIVIKKNGSFLITKVSDKQFVGKDIEYAGVFRKNDERTIYNMIYRDGSSGASYMKRCAINGLTRDKEYSLTQGKPGSRILYLSVNPNGEAETVKVTLKPRPRLKKLTFNVHFSDLSIKGKSSIGNITTRYPVHKIELKEKGSSTLGGMKIWWDETVHRLNDDAKGKYLGEFNNYDRLLIITLSGVIRLSGYELSTHFEEDLVLIEKYDPGKVFTVVYYDGKQKYYYIKRFSSESTDKQGRYFDEHPKSRLIILCEEDFPRIEVRFAGKNKKRASEIIEAADFINVKSYKARGKRLSNYEIGSVTKLKSLRFRENVKAAGGDSESEDIEPATKDTGNVVTVQEGSEEDQVVAEEAEDTNVAVKDTGDVETVAESPEKQKEPDKKSSKVRGKNGEQMSLF
ncbi:MAG: DNA gyrase/topoisomerase IV subunit A [Bacteroidales bacterium]|nr:DNA gyrase/topoisomerase IV subunit A [Bacteroidales bacterium]